MDLIAGNRAADENTVVKADSTDITSAKPSTESDIESKHANRDPYLLKGRLAIIGYTAVGIQVAAFSAIASTYATGSYKPVAGSIFRKQKSLGLRLE
ncbi:hypothetical protein ACJ73_08357 [Blastomyces percursus]|uniref:Uncharacterized protein n=1 Tax=Blastomyces percursus TaxID=1658174 RepID=A0A1J9PVI3_9EURO|nr:hypothetical protein ACJ73_08357 [Blastomyces percursus]